MYVDKTSGEETQHVFQIDIKCITADRRIVASRGGFSFENVQRHAYLVQ